jgi:predicted glycogen debranching enzyme
VNLAPLLEIAFERDVCGDLAQSTRREWLVTNGLGGFASGTISGLQTRRYHGLLVAALEPPARRTVLVALLSETVGYDGGSYELATACWRDGAIVPEGYRYLERFALDGEVPVWTYALSDALVEKRIWMEHGANTTYVMYRVLRARAPLELQVKALVNYRDFHGNTHAGDWQMSIDPIADGIRVVAFEGATPFVIRSDRAASVPEHVWYRNYELPEERARGLDDTEDRLLAATFWISLVHGESITFVASVAEDASTDGDAALLRQHGREHSLLDSCGEVPFWIARLALAADQFIVRHPSADDPGALSVIAGYHWFGDWGRDTMIALPGLTLATRREAITARILESWAAYLDGGLLPNVFPGAGEPAAYNSVDAALWFIEAVRQYVDATSDVALLRRLYPSLVDIVDRYRAGTRFGIMCDPADGLIWAGQSGVALTWMDAKIGDVAVTPRIGKPIEVNALWYNALRTIASCGPLLEEPRGDYEQLAQQTRDGFARYWNEERSHCYDVLDGPNGNDASLRPNQLFAVSLPHSPLSPDRQRMVVDVCGSAFLTTNGLRTLAADDPQFRPRYAGSPEERDGAYHQGTVWTWLLGPYVTAHLRVYQNVDAAQTILETAARQFYGYGIGTLAEVADATAPFRQNGAIAQAWSVAEILRAWRYLTANVPPRYDRPDRDRRPSTV